MSIKVLSEGNQIIPNFTDRIQTDVMLSRDIEVLEESLETV